jgi:hypothetical protein
MKVALRSKLIDLIGRVRLGNADGFGKLGDRRASEQMNDIRGKGFRLRLPGFSRTAANSF